MNIRSVALAVALIALCGVSCGKANQGPGTTPADSVPLDGRGGGVIAYSRQPGASGGLHEIFGINADGTGNRQLVSASIGLNHHDWSPDGQRMVAVGYVSDVTWSIYGIDLRAGTRIRLTNVAGVWDTEPAWSPDGTRVAFTRILEAGSGSRELWMMNADGSDQHSIGVEGFGARWSPDGGRLVFASDHAGTWDLYVCDADGTDVAPLLAAAADEASPVWSPDGSAIAFTSNSDGDGEVFVTAPDGSNVRQLTHNDAADHYPRWSPNGSQIAFDSDLCGGGQREVYVMEADGSAPRRVTHTSPPHTSIIAVWKP